eukprot:TRINITY_DN2187_c0_g2_i1.p1 TRINITY_DN2187_c0_g2~~TRINITY_DN2187_c0_g2_i1.p1  ORF type:complete len:967 (-),score=154.45 TRINITY_DN2187_c0_g2_i1:37-2937(-)
MSAVARESAATVLKRAGIAKKAHAATRSSAKENESSTKPISTSDSCGVFTNADTTAKSSAVGTATGNEARTPPATAGCVDIDAPVSVAVFGVNCEVAVHKLGMMTTMVDTAIGTISDDTDTAAAGEPVRTASGAAATVADGTVESQGTIDATTDHGAVNVGTPVDAGGNDVWHPTDDAAVAAVVAGAESSAAAIWHAEANDETCDRAANSGGGATVGVHSSNARFGKGDACSATTGLPTGSATADDLHRFISKQRLEEESDDEEVTTVVVERRRSASASTAWLLERLAAGCKVVTPSATAGKPAGLWNVGGHGVAVHPVESEAERWYQEGVRVFGHREEVPSFSSKTRGSLIGDSGEDSEEVVISSFKLVERGSATTYSREVMLTVRQLLLQRKRQRRLAGGRGRIVTAPTNCEAIVARVGNTKHASHERAWTALNATQHKATKSGCVFANQFPTSRPPPQPSRTSHGSGYESGCCGGGGSHPTVRRRGRGKADSARQDEAQLLASPSQWHHAPFDMSARSLSRGRSPFKCRPTRASSEGPRRYRFDPEQISRQQTFPDRCGMIAAGVRRAAPSAGMAMTAATTVTSISEAPRQSAATAAIAAATANAAASVRQSSPEARRRRHYFGRGDSSSDDHGDLNRDASGACQSSQRSAASASEATQPKPRDGLARHCLEQRGGGLNRWIAASTGGCGLLFIGLSLEHCQDILWGAARAFASCLSAELHVDLHIARNVDTLSSPGKSSIIAADTASEADLLSESADGQQQRKRRWPQHSQTSECSSPFQRPRVLHMTTFYFGAGMPASFSPAASRALELEGSRWPVRVTHLLYADGALLVAALEVAGSGMPMEASCLPHATLLFRPPFVPGHARAVMERALAAGLLDSPRGDGAAIQLLPRAQLDGASVDIYVQRLQAPRRDNTSESAVGAAAESVAVLEGRLTSFWEHGLGPPAAPLPWQPLPRESRLRC